MLASEECPIEQDETSQELSIKMANIGSELLIKVLNDLPKHMETKKTQPSEGVTYAPKITKDMFEIRWEEKSAQEIYNQYRALQNFHNSSKLYSYWKDTQTIVRFDEVLPPDMLKNLVKLSDNDEKSVPGQVISKKVKNHGRILCIKCANGWIAFKRIYYGQRKVMNMSDFYNGFLHSNQGHNSFSRYDKSPS